MGKKVTLGYLGYKFQQELINQILHPANKKFSERIIDIIHAPYFDNEYFRLLIVTIKDYYERFDKVPEWDTLETVLTTSPPRKVPGLSSVPTCNGASGLVVPIPTLPELSIFKRLLPPVTKLSVLVPEEYKPVSVSPSKVREGCDAEPNSRVNFGTGESVVRRVPPAVGKINV